MSCALPAVLLLWNSVVAPLAVVMVALPPVAVCEKVTDELLTMLALPALVESWKKTKLSATKLTLALPAVAEFEKKTRAVASKVCTFEELLTMPAPFRAKLLSLRL